MLTTLSNRKSNDTIIAEFTYSYDTTYWGKNGTRTRVVENILKPDSNRIRAQVDYEYDDLYRLLHEHRIDDPNVQGSDAGVEYEYNFAYDDAGNRTSWETVGGSTITYTYDAANKMTGPGTFTYDAKGNTLTHIVSSITTTYTWDYLNRMTQWEKTNEMTQTYVYNADGMRVRVTPSGGTATEFLLDGKEIAEEVTGGNATSYIGGITFLASRIIDGNREVFHADGVGSTRAMSDSNQAINEAGIHDGYGNETIIAGAAPRFGYAGQSRYYSDSPGLFYLKARYYDPVLGRFVSKDSFGYVDGLNLYAYAHGNPVCMIDPDGHFAWVPIIGIVIIGIGIEQGAESAIGAYMCGRSINEVLEWARYYQDLFPDDTQKRWKYLTETAAYQNMIEYCGEVCIGSYTGPLDPQRL